MSEIAALEAIAVRLPMTAAFATSRGCVGSPGTGREVVLVRLTDAAGRAGWGEAGPVPAWSPETLGSVLDALRHHLAAAVIGRDPGDLAGLHAAMDAGIAPGPGRGMPIAKAGVDLAAHDLVGRRLGLPLWRLLGRRGAPTVRLSWTLLGADPLESLRQGRAAGFRNFNLKVGGPEGPRADADRVRAVRAEAPGAFLWADANGGYAAHRALPAARALAAAGADVLEQPLPPHALRACHELVAAGVLPIALDESVTAPEDLAEALGAGALDLLTLKVTRTGGLHPSRICAEMALAHGLGLLSSGLTDAGLAFAANVALAAAFGLERPCALNGPQLLGDDVLAAPLQRDGDVVSVADAPGLGVEVDADKVAFYRLPL